MHFVEDFKPTVTLSSLNGKETWEFYLMCKDGDWIGVVCFYTDVYSRRTAPLTLGAAVAAEIMPRLLSADYAVIHMDDKTWTAAVQQVFGWYRLSQIKGRFRVGRGRNTYFNLADAVDEALRSAARSGKPVAVSAYTVREDGEQTASGILRQIYLAGS